VKFQTFRVIAPCAEQAGLKAIKPGNFLRTRKVRMVSYIVRDANEFIER
jgi:hypothetical protein